MRSLLAAFLILAMIFLAQAFEDQMEEAPSRAKRYGWGGYGGYGGMGYGMYRPWGYGGYGMGMGMYRPWGMYGMWGR